MDAQTIGNANSYLKKLQTCPVASCFCNACQSHSPGCYFEKFYDDCKIHLMDVGHQAGMDDSSMNTYDYNKCMSETLDMF
jgi:hypothetical protein